MNLFRAIRILFHKHKWGIWITHSVYMGDDYEERQCLICGAIEEHDFQDDFSFIHYPESDRQIDLYRDLK